MLHAIVLYNDRFVASREPVLPLGHVGLFTGWGVFTTLRVYEGVPFAFERHWDRLERDARLLHVPMPPDRDELLHRLTGLIRRNGCPEAKMRLNIVRSLPRLWESSGAEPESDVVAFTADVDVPPPSASLLLHADGRHTGSRFAGTKTLSWAHNLTLFERASGSGFTDVLLLNELGEVCECTSANVFVVRDGTVVTPFLASGALPGVTRQVMLEELAEPISEGTLRESDLYEADEVFITSSTRELVPVARIGDRKQDGPWPVTERLRDRFRAYVSEYVRSARQSGA